MIHCDLYLKAEKELNCTKEGYLLGYAYPICERMHLYDWMDYELSIYNRYTYNSELTFPVQSLVLCITDLLQQYLLQQLRYSNPFPLSPCVSIAHTFLGEREAYTRCGFCLLPAAWPHFREVFKLAHSLVFPLNTTIMWPGTGYIPTIESLIYSCTDRYAWLKSEKYANDLNKIVSQFKEFSKTSLIEDLITKYTPKHSDSMVGYLIEQYGNEASFDISYTEREKLAAELYPKDNSLCSFLKAFFQRNLEINIDCPWVWFYLICFLLYPLILGVCLHCCKGCMNWCRNKMGINVGNTIDDERRPLTFLRNLEELHPIAFNLRRHVRHLEDLRLIEVNLKKHANARAEVQPLSRSRSLANLHGS